MSLFSEKDQLMHKADKAQFAQTCLKSKVKCVDPYDHRIGNKVIDGGWLLRQVSWEKGRNWETIISDYVTYVQSIGRNASQITVAFDGYESSTKDHDH